MNADVNAFERLQMVRGLKSSYFGSKYKSCTVRARRFRSLKFALDKRFVNDHLNDHLRRDVAELASLPGFRLLSHGLEVALHTVDAD